MSVIFPEIDICIVSFGGHIATAVPRCVFGTLSMSLQRTTNSRFPLEFRFFSVTVKSRSNDIRLNISSSAATLSVNVVFWGDTELAEVEISASCQHDYTDTHFGAIQPYWST